MSDHVVEEAGSAGLSRRQVLARGALAGLAASLAGLLGDEHLIAVARAQSTDLTTQTMNGLLAFIAPGNDTYSKHQGESTPRPGGVGSNTVGAFIDSLNKFVPASVLSADGASVPSSSGVAALLNLYATQVDPAASGPFLSSFANLTFAKKAEVLQLLEAKFEPSDTELAFVAGILPGFATFVTFSEAGVFDSATGKLTGRPVGWDLTDYAGPSDGWPEFRGYYQDRRKVKGSGPWATRSPRG